MVTGGHTWSQVVILGQRCLHLVTLFIVEVTELHNDGLNGLMVIVSLRIMVTYGHRIVKGGHICHWLGQGPKD